MFSMILLFVLSGCGKAREAFSLDQRNTDISEELNFDHSMELSYAREFAVDYYEKDYALITISDGSQYLVIPEGETEPSDLSEEIVVLQKPVENIYLVASAVMDMFVSLDSLDSIRFSGLQENGWYIEDARKAMQSEDILYAGKYSAPDYEKILEEGCDLAIENTICLLYTSPSPRD